MDGIILQQMPILVFIAVLFNGLYFMARIMVRWINGECTFFRIEVNISEGYIYHEWDTVAMFCIK